MMSRPMRVFRIPFSTNVERVALALGHKGVAVEWVDVDPADRWPVRDVSGQDLVPVLQTDENEIVVDSMQIVAWLESRRPDPPLWPADPAPRGPGGVARGPRPAGRGRRVRRLVQPRVEGAAERDRGGAAATAARPGEDRPMGRG